MGFNVFYTPVATQVPNLGGEFQNELDLLLNSYALKIADDLAEPTKTWTHKVTFRRDLIKTSDRIVQSIYTTDEIYYYLNSGTRVRRAKLSRDWQNKTFVASLRSGPGSGRVVAISKKFAFKGIDARAWTSLVAAKHEQNFYRDVQEIINKISL